MLPNLASALGGLSHIDFTAVGLDDAAVACLVAGLRHSRVLHTLVLAHNAIASSRDLCHLFVALRRTLTYVFAFRCFAFN